MHLTAECDSAVCTILLSQTPHWLCCVHPTAESNCTPKSQNRKLCLLLKRQSEVNPIIGDHSCHGGKDLKYKKGCSLSLKFWLPGLMHTAESEFSNFMIKYLDKIGIKLENILAWLSWTLLDLNYKEKKRPKISWRPPFKETCVLFPQGRSHEFRSFGFWKPILLQHIDDIWKNKN